MRDYFEKFKMMESSPLMILVAPQLEENVGAAARAMGNFGLSELCLVAPRFSFPSLKAQRSACLAGKEVLARTTVEYSLEKALGGDVSYVLALTSRRRSVSVPVITLEEACLRGRRAKRCAILFGGEHSGLDNDAIALSDHLVTIPAYGASPSLNLAQSVMLTAYVWRCHKTEKALFSQREYSNPAYREKEEDYPTMEEFIIFFRRLELLLEQEGFFTQERKAVVVQKLRTIFKRSSLRKNELALFRAVIETLAKRTPQP